MLQVKAKTAVSYAFYLTNDSSFLLLNGQSLKLFFLVQALYNFYLCNITLCIATGFCILQVVYKPKDLLKL